MYSGVERTTTRVNRPSTWPKRPAKRRETAGKPEKARRRPVEHPLAGLIHPELVNVRLSAATKDEVINELLELIASHNLVSEITAVRDALFARERQLSTGLEHGIAIPHARTDAVQKLVCAVGIKREGIEFGSLDGRPSSIFIMTLSPRDASVPYAQVIATITRTLKAEVRAQLLSAETAEEACNVLLGRAPK